MYEIPFLRCAVLYWRQIVHFIIIKSLYLSTLMKALVELLLLIGGKNMNNSDCMDYIFIKNGKGF